MVVKYADNILKGFAASFCIVSSCALSWLFMGFHPTLIFVCGAILVMFSMYLYSYTPPAKKNDDFSDLKLSTSSAINLRLEKDLLKGVSIVSQNSLQSV